MILQRSFDFRLETIFEALLFHIISIEDFVMMSCFVKAIFVGINFVLQIWLY